MYISVIPLSHSLSKKPYIYFVGENWRENIKVGFLVEIPIGRYIVCGIISEVGIEKLEDIDATDIKAIIRVIASIEIASKNMIEVIISLANVYFLLIHKVASMFLPAPLLTRLDKKNYILKEDESEMENRKWKIGNVKIHHYIDHIFHTGDLERYLLPKSIFIFPDDVLLSYFSGGIGEEKKHIIGIFPNDLTPTKRAQSWIDIYEKKYDIIFGTRRILYYNLEAYSHLVYIEDAFGAEQYQYPIRIQNLDILKALEMTESFDITIVSSSPTLQMLSLFQKGKITAIH